MEQFQLHLAPDGKIGIFESNSIMRLVARLKDKTISTIIWIKPI